MNSAPSQQQPLPLSAEPHSIATCAAHDDVDDIFDLDAPAHSQRRFSSGSAAGPSASGGLSHSPGSAESISRRSSRSSVGGWNARSDAKLRRLVQTNGAGPDRPTEWKVVAKEMRAWSARQCEARFKKISSATFVETDELDETNDSDDDPLDSEPESPAPVRVGVRRAAWTAEEDRVLKETVLARRGAGEPVDWASFPKILPGRTESACTKRWHHQFARLTEGGSGLWTEAEDDILRSTVLERRARGVRVDWASFPALLPGRTRISCTQRWHNVLSRESAMTEVVSGAGHWSSDNDELLATVVRRRRSSGLPNDWAAIAENFPGRTALGCQKRWYQHVRSADDAKDNESVHQSGTSTPLSEADPAERTPRDDSDSSLLGQKKPSATDRRLAHLDESSSESPSSSASASPSNYSFTLPSIGRRLASALTKQAMSAASTPEPVPQGLMHHTPADAGVAEILSSWSQRPAFTQTASAPATTSVKAEEAPVSPRQIRPMPSLSRLSLAHLAPDSGPAFKSSPSEPDERSHRTKRAKTEFEELDPVSWFAPSEKVQLPRINAGRDYPDHLSPFNFGLPPIRHA